MRCVSIIIPAYNPGAFLRSALESIQRQTFTDWELVVVNDGSKENLDWICQDFPHTRLINQKNAGASVARNTGILSTTGEFIAFMDQDDLWLPTKLERQVKALHADANAGVCYCDLEIINSEGRVMDKSEIDQHSTDSNLFIVELDTQTDKELTGHSPLHRSLLHFSQRFVVPSTVMIRRHCLAGSGLLDPFIPFSGDYDLLIKLGSKHRVIRVPEVVVQYRKHGNNFSDQYEVGSREVKALVGRYVSYAEANGDNRLAKSAPHLLRRPGRIFSAQAVDRARRSLRESDYVSVAYHLWRALIFNFPFAIRSVVTWALSKLRR